MTSVRLLKLALGIILIAAPSITFGQIVAQGIYGGYNYEAVLASGGITWSNAEAAAISMGGQLASVTSAGEENFIYGLVSSNAALWQYEGGNTSGAGIGPWLGGYRSPQNTGGTFHWIDGATFSYTDWSPGEPNDYGGDENYIEFYSSPGLMGNTWNDYPNVTPDANHLGPNPNGYVVEVAVPEAGTSGLFATGALGLALILLRERPAAGRHG